MLRSARAEFVAERTENCFAASCMACAIGSNVGSGQRRWQRCNCESFDCCGCCCCYAALLLLLLPLLLLPLLLLLFYLMAAVVVASAVVSAVVVVSKVQIICSSTRRVAFAFLSLSLFFSSHMSLHINFRCTFVPAFAIKKNILILTSGYCCTQQGEGDGGGCALQRQRQQKSRRHAK